MRIKSVANDVGIEAARNQLALARDNAEPTGAPNPLEKQTETVSNKTPMLAGEFLLTCNALKILAPSR